MGPKKKGGKEDVEDNTTRELLLTYRKMVKESEVTISKTLDSKLVEILEEDGKLPEALINEKIGESGMRVLINALMKVNGGKGYKHLQSIRVWDGDIGDEGARAISQFITDTHNSSVTIIELLNCGIGPLGCELLSRVFEPSLPSKISILTLDYNTFGNAGLYKLMDYLKMSSSLKYLSLSYCDIDEKGISYLESYLPTTTCLETLNLQGNPLKNAGVKELISILSHNTTVEEININNTMFGNDPNGVISDLASLMINNQTLVAYQIKFNFITDQALKEDCPHICQMTIDEKISKPLFDEFYKLMKGRKRKPKGKKKGGGKKTKKDKKK